MAFLRSLTVAHLLLAIDLYVTSTLGADVTWRLPFADTPGERVDRGGFKHRSFTNLLQLDLTVNGPLVNSYFSYSEHYRTMECALYRRRHSSSKSVSFSIAHSNLFVHRCKGLLKQNFSMSLITSCHVDLLRCSCPRPMDE